MILSLKSNLLVNAYCLKIIDPCVVITAESGQIDCTLRLCKPMHHISIVFPLSTTGCCFYEAGLPEGKNMQKLFQLFGTFTQSVGECFGSMRRGSFAVALCRMF